MIISAPFIVRPVATTLLTLAVVLAGLLSFFLLPVARCRRWTFPPSRCRPACPAPAPDHGLQRGHAAGTLAGQHRRRDRDDLQQFAGLDPRHAAVRPEPRHQWRRARCAGRHQRGALAAADQPAQQSYVSQVQPVGRAHHDAGADFRHAQPGPALRPGLDHRGTEAVAGGRRGRSDGGRQLRPCASPCCRRAGQPRRVAGRRAHGAGQCQPPQGRAGERPLSLAGHGQRPAQPRRAIQAADRGLARRRAGARVGRGQGRGFG